MNAVPNSPKSLCQGLRLQYRSSNMPLPPDLLGAILFGRDSLERCRALGDPRLVGVPLDTLPGSADLEVWRSSGEIRSGERDGVRFSADADHLFAAIDIDEAVWGDLRSASREAYLRLASFQNTGVHPHVLRIWNFMDAINAGSGDAERYRQFCLGRAEGMADHLRDFPAASALGRRDGRRLLQVIWLAGRQAGTPVENPRQLSAYRYPRRYGPAPPSFSRAQRIGELLLISGTASIVGHETLHAGQPEAQLQESVRNLEAVSAAAGTPGGRLEAVKAYLRHPDYAAAVRSGLHGRCVEGTPSCLLLADICRSDLLIELEAVYRS